MHYLIMMCGWLQFLWNSALICPLFCLYGENAGQTLVSLLGGIYLATGYETLVLYSLINILGIGLANYLQCVLLLIEFVPRGKRKEKRDNCQCASLAFGGRGTGILRYKTKRNGKKFDATLGYPGEGWSTSFPNLRMATWNSRSMTQERFAYCKSLKYDVLALTELWRTQQKYQNSSKAFIASEPKIIQKGTRKGEQGRYDFQKTGRQAWAFCSRQWHRRK